MGDVLVILAALLFFVSWFVIELTITALVTEGPERIREWRRDREHLALEEKALAKKPRTSLLRPAKRVAESETLLRSTESDATERTALRPTMGSR